MTKSYADSLMMMGAILTLSITMTVTIIKSKQKNQNVNYIMFVIMNPNIDNHYM